MDHYVGDKIAVSSFSVYSGMFRNNKAAYKSLIGHGADSTLRSELNSLLELDHHNIINFFGIEKGEENGEQFFYVITGYCPLGDLSGMIHNPKVIYSCENIIKWGYQLFDVLSYLQKQNVVHRDLKPQNILIETKNLKIKLCDFGISKSSTSAVMSQKSTFRYMAPETATEYNKTARFSFKSDLYSAALILWELVERRTVFYAYDPYICHMMVAKRLLRLPKPRCLDVLATIIQRCSRLNMNERPDAADARDSMEQVRKSRNYCKNPEALLTVDSLVEIQRPTDIYGVPLKIKPIKFKNVEHRPFERRAKADEALKRVEHIKFLSENYGLPVEKVTEWSAEIYKNIEESKGIQEGVRLTLSRLHLLAANFEMLLGKLLFTREWCRLNDRPQDYNEYVHARVRKRNSIRSWFLKNPRAVTAKALRPIDDEECPSSNFEREWSAKYWTNDRWRKLRIRDGYWVWI